MQKTQGENQLGVLAEQKGPCGDSRGSERWVRLGGRRGQTARSGAGSPGADHSHLPAA